MMMPEDALAHTLNTQAAKQRERATHLSHYLSEAGVICTSSQVLAALGEASLKLKKDDEALAARELLLSDNH